MPNLNAETLHTILRRYGLPHTPWHQLNLDQQNVLDGMVININDLTPTTHDHRNGLTLHRFYFHIIEEKYDARGEWDNMQQSLKDRWHGLASAYNAVKEK